MTQIQTQIQGPQIFAQPTQPVMYQETETILPRPGVSIGLGIDWGSIGQSVAGTAIEVTKAFNEYQFDKKASLLEKMSNIYQSGIEAAMDINDSLMASELKNRWSSEAKDLLGYDPDTETPFSQADRKLINSYRSGVANTDAIIEKRQRDWTDTIAQESVSTLVLNLEREIQEGKITPEEAEEQLEQAHATVSNNLPFDAAIPEYGYTVGQRRALLGLREQAIKFNEMQLKAEASKKTAIEQNEDPVKNLLRLSASYFQRAQKTQKAAEDAASRNDRVTEQNLQAQAIREFTNGMYFKNMAEATLRTSFQQDLKNNNDHQGFMQAKEREDDPKFLEEFILSDVNPEIVTQWNQALEAEHELRNSQYGYSYSTVEKIKKQQFDSAGDQVDTKASEVARQITLLDEELKRVDSENDPRATEIRKEKYALLARLRHEFREHIFGYVDPSVKEYKPSLTQMLKGKWLQGLGKRALNDLALDFSADSVQYLSALVGNDTNVIALYQKQIKTVNDLIQKAAIEPSTGSGGFRKQKEDEDNYILFRAGKVTKSPLSQEERINFSNTAARDRFGVSEDMPFSEFQSIPLDELRERARKNQDKNSRFSMHHLMHTSLWGRLLTESQLKETPEEAAAFVEGFLADVLTKDANGVYHTDQIEASVNPHQGELGWNVQTMVDLLGDPSKRNNVTMGMLLYLPEHSAMAVLNTVKRNTDDHSWLNTIETAVRLYHQEGRTDTPFGFFRNNVWVTSKSEARRTLLREASKVDSKDTKNELAPISRWYKDGVLKQVLRDIRLPGYNPDVSGHPNMVMSMFKEVIEDAVLIETNAEPDFTKFKDTSKIVDRVNRYIETKDFGISNDNIVADYSRRGDKRTTEIPRNMVSNVPTSEGRVQVILGSDQFSDLPNAESILVQFGPTRNTSTIQDLKVNPFIGSILHGANQYVDDRLRTRIGGNLGWNDIVATAVEGLPRTNQTVLSAIAALKKAGSENFENTEQALQFINTTTRQVYNDITNGGGRYQTRVVDAPIYFGGSRGTAPTIEVIDTTNNIAVSNMQPNGYGISNYIPNKKVFDNFNPAKFYAREAMGETYEPKLTGSSILDPREYGKILFAEVGDKADISDVVSKPPTDSDYVIANYLMTQDKDSITLPVYEEKVPASRIVFKKQVKDNRILITREYQRKGDNGWFTSERLANSEDRAEIRYLAVKEIPEVKKNPPLGNDSKPTEPFTPNLLRNDPFRSFRVVPVQEEFNAMISELESQNTYRSVFTRNLVEPEPEQGGPIYEEPIMDLFGDTPDQNPLDFVPLSVEEEVLGYVKDAENAAIQGDVKSRQEFLRQASQPPSFSTSLNKLWQSKQPGRRDPYDKNKWEPVSLDSNMPIESAKQYPNLNVGSNNQVKTIITYDRQTRTFALVPDRFNGDSTKAEFWRRKTKKQLGLFKSREDALLYQARLEEFLNNNK